MSWSHLSPEQADRAEQIFQSLRLATEADLRGLAELLASKEDRQLLGPTEFEVRDRVHKIGAKAIETAIDQRKKGVPRVEPDLPPLPRRRPLRRLSSQGAAQSAGGDPSWAGLLPLPTVPSGPLPR